MRKKAGFGVKVGGATEHNGGMKYSLQHNKSPEEPQNFDHHQSD